MIDITVLITAYNRKEYLIKAVDSVLNQSLNKNHYEIIVIKNFKDNYIDDYLTNNNIKNIIMDGTEGDYILKGMEESRGKIISFLDDDDIFHNEKLQYIYNIFNKYDDLIYFHNAYLEIDNNDNLLQLNSDAIRATNFNDFILNQKNNESILDGLKHLSDFNLSSIAIAKSIKDTEYVSHIFHMTDTSLFYLALTHNGTIYISSTKLTMIRRHISTSRPPLDDENAMLGSLQNNNISQIILFIQNYCKNYPFYNLVQCMFYSNRMMEQLIKNEYHNVFGNVIHFFRCIFLLNSKERLGLTIIYIISYILKNNKLFVILFKRIENRN